MDRIRSKLLFRASIITNLIAILIIWQLLISSNNNHFSQIGRNEENPSRYNPLAFLNSGNGAKDDGPWRDTLVWDDKSEQDRSESDHLRSKNTESVSESDIEREIEKEGLPAVLGNFDNQISRQQPQCGICQANHTLCDEIGEAGMQKMISYAGSNLRLRRALAKMRQGLPFNVGVAGGSVSRGHGLRVPNEPYAHTNMNRVIFDHLNDLFPAKNGVIEGESGKKVGKNGFINGAQGGLGSDYFSLCFSEHIPKDVDIVLIELAINDQMVMKNLDNYELLVRALLDLPSSPAILNLHIGRGGDLHNGVSLYYDTPVLSLRNYFLPKVFLNHTVIHDMFVENHEIDPNNVGGFDLRHISANAHGKFGQIVNSYIDWQLCEMDRIEAIAGTNDIDILYPLEPLPRLRLTDKFNPTTVLPKIDPNCLSANSEVNPLVPSANQGWRNWNWKAKKYIIADVPGSKVTFDFSTSIGEVVLYYLRSATFGLGSVDCWVDDEYDRKVRLDGYWSDSTNVGQSVTIRSDLKPGIHKLHCELLESTMDPNDGHEFRIISLMSI